MTNNKKAKAQEGGRKSGKVLVTGVPISAREKSLNRHD